LRRQGGIARVVAIAPVAENAVEEGGRGWFAEVGILKDAQGASGRGGGGNLLVAAGFRKGDADEFGTVGVELAQIAIRQYMAGRQVQTEDVALGEVDRMTTTMPTASEVIMAVAASFPFWKLAEPFGFFPLTPCRGGLSSGQAGNSELVWRESKIMKDRLFRYWPLVVLLFSPLNTQAAESAKAAAPKFVEVLATADILRQVRAGGFTLYLRHGNTDNSRPDRVPNVDLDDCSTQRPLNEEGRTVATRVGDAMRKARIPFAEMHISPLCRVRDTAAAAFPKTPYQVDKNLMYVANLNDEQKAPIIARTRQLLSAPTPTGSNRLVVAHAPNLMELIGYFPKEGTLVVFRPIGTTFEYVASIPPNHWASLLD
jgi:phosphohistidine phosphatase SixA